MTGFSSHFGPEEEYVLASFATGLRTFLEVTDDSIIRGCPAKPCQKLCLLSLLTVLSQPIPYLTRFDWPDLSICYHICDFYIVCAAYSRNHARYQPCALELIFEIERSVSQPWYMWGSEHAAGWASPYTWVYNGNPLGICIRLEHKRWRRSSKQKKRALV